MCGAIGATQGAPSEAFFPFPFFPCGNTLPEASKGATGGERGQSPDWMRGLFFPSPSSHAATLRLRLVEGRRSQEQVHLLIR